MPSLLDRITEKDVYAQPYPFLTTTEALDPAYYRTLAGHFPDVTAIACDFGGDEAVRTVKANNVLMHVNGYRAMVGKFPVDPVWREFLAFHFSADFYRQLVTHLGDGIRCAYPDLERRLGKPLEALTVQPRRAPDSGADLMIDIQFAINTAVARASRVRARHVDDPKKLFAGLFYMRPPDDDSVGGDLEICGWRDEPRFLNAYVEGRQVSNTHIQDDQVELARTVKYRANTLAFFVNSVQSVHGVTERRPTPHLRRYVNIIVEARQPLYDLRRYCGKDAPWALTMIPAGAGVRPA